jgi:hypothetical protein
LGALAQRDVDKLNLFIAQQAVADTPHVPGMPSDQMLERLFVVVVDEVRQKTMVRPVIQAPFNRLQQRYQWRKSFFQVTLVLMALFSAVVNIKT